MGQSRFDADDWNKYAKASDFDQKTPDQVINKSKVHDDLLPTNFKNGIRESRDSDVNPESTAIIVAGDVTGSMGPLAGALIKDGLAKFATEVYDRKPVTDPHIMGMAVGDAYGDTVPIQCTEFEADIKIIQQFERLFVEGNGQGNHQESYSIPWLVAAMMTRHDGWEKRQRKGVLFTYGDEGAPFPVKVHQAQSYLGLTLEKDLTAEEILAMVSRTYDVYHLIIEQGAEGRLAHTTDTWRDLLGERVRFVDDHTKLAETMVSILQVRGGMDRDAVIKSWNGTTAVTVARAIDNLPATANHAKNAMVAI